MEQPFHPAIPLKQLPLHNIHQEAGAKFVPFAGWNMPVSYPMGVMAEHLHCREKAGLFDISHMKLIEVKGSDAANFLNYALPLKAEAMAVGQSRYNYLLNENAAILDDLIVTKLGDDRFFIVVNASNADKDYQILQERAQNFNCQILPQERVILALQGPKAAAVLKDLAFDIDDLLFMQAKEQDGLFIARSGYTGEDGFELAIPLEKAGNLAKQFLAHADVAVIGLAARDSLRLEAGLCLHGNDITIQHNPVEAGLLWAIPKTLREEGQFIGADALRRELANGPKKCRVGFKVQTKQPVRAGAKVFAPDHSEIGVVTSGGFGPSFGGPIAMGYVLSAYKASESELYAIVRDRPVPMTICKLPFVEQRYVKA